MSRATEELMDRLHASIAEELLNRVTSGEATAADLQAAIKFLKDNGIEGVAKDDTALARLKDQLADIPDDAILDNILEASCAR
jgi:hypothetical protein